MDLSIPLGDVFYFVTEGSARSPIARRIEKIDEGVDKAKTFSVSFRQGSQAEDLERTNWTSRRKYSYDRAQRDLVEISELNPDELARLEVGITLSATDLSIGSYRVPFTESAGITRISDRAAFELWWGLLPSQFCREIYQCCLEVNPSWAPKRQ